MTASSVTRREFLLTFSCPDRPGIVHEVARCLADEGGNIIDSAQFGDPDTKRFFMRVHFDTAQAENALQARVSSLATDLAMDWQLRPAEQKPRVVIMLSKLEHCLIDLLYRVRSGEIAIDVALIVSNHRGAYRIAAEHDIDFLHLPITPATKRVQESSLLDEISKRSIDFVVLARYMQILGEDVCRALPGRAINIHHSFLPSFKGARPYHQAHDHGVKLIGATAHYVTADLDEGPIIEQGVERVDHRTTPDQLVAVGRDIERVVLAKAVRYQSEQRILLNGHRTVVFD